MLWSNWQLVHSCGSVGELLPFLTKIYEINPTTLVIFPVKGWFIWFFACFFFPGSLKIWGCYNSKSRSIDIVLDTKLCIKYLRFQDPPPNPPRSPLGLGHSISNVFWKWCHRKCRFGKNPGQFSLRDHKGQMETHVIDWTLCMWVQFSPVAWTLPTQTSGSCGFCSFIPNISSLDFYFDQTQSTSFTSFWANY